MATTATADLVARNPANGAEIARVPVTPPEDVALLVASARAAQESWGALPIGERVAVVRRFWKILSRDHDVLARAIRDEIGKPEAEARFEVVGTLDALRWTVKNARRVLTDERLGPGWQRAALLGPAVVKWRPLGVIGIVGTWNYPLLLDAPTLAQALVAGNAVAWKPSERCSFVASLVRDRLAEARFPDGLVASLFGGPEVARALVASGNLAKGVFTGGIEAGRAVAVGLAQTGTPAVLELSGFDPAIVLPDSPFDATVKALTWAAFVGCGQTCVGVKRIYVVGDPRPWAVAIAERANLLRVGDPAGGVVDVGPMISEEARDGFHRTIVAAVAAGAEVICGGEPIAGPGWFYRPTVLLNRGGGAEAELEGVFGPVVIVDGVGTDDEAASRANFWHYGLAASVWGRDRTRCRRLADRLESGMVTINDAVTPSGHASSPFGGTKGSGHGRTRGAFGLREFVEPQARHERRPGGFRPHLFPYSGKLDTMLGFYRRWFHRPR